MDGILVINKPKGISSHDVVDRVRRVFGIRKVGHTGTLDPLATGVLVMLMGKSTKLSAKLSQDNKEYIATLFLGKSTTTQDIAGRVLEEKDILDIDIPVIKDKLDSFLGENTQVPPMMSAKKYKGVALYKLARRGKTIARKPCKVHIHEIELLKCALPEITFRVKCSKGTYIRTLCEDIGRALGYPAHMSNLIRTKSGRFSLDEACELGDINEKDILPA